MLIFCGCFNYDKEYVVSTERNKGRNKRSLFLIANTHNLTLECYTALEIQRNASLLKDIRIEGLNLDVFGKPYRWLDIINNDICSVVSNTIIMKDYRYKVTRLLYNLTFKWGICTINYNCSSVDSTVLEFNDYVSKDRLSFQSCMSAFCFNRIDLSRYYDLEILDFRPFDMRKVGSITIINSLTQTNLKEIYFGNLNLYCFRKLDTLGSMFVCLELLDFTDFICDLDKEDKRNFYLGFLEMGLVRFVLLNKNTPLFNQKMIKHNKMVKLKKIVSKLDSSEEINKIKAKSVLIGNLGSNNAIIIDK